MSKRISLALLGRGSLPQLARLLLIFGASGPALGDIVASARNVQTPAVDVQAFAPLGTSWETRRTRQNHQLDLRATRWRADNWGLATELTQTGANKTGVASDSVIIAQGFGPVLLTFSAMRRFLVEPRVQAYGGAGLGSVVALNHDLSSVALPLPQQDGTSAARIVAGASYAIDARWSVFGEYVATYYWQGPTAAPAAPEADMLTHALNIGIGFSF